MIGIIVDTNIIRNKDINSVAKFVQKHEKAGVLYIPEVVLDEMLMFYSNLFTTEFAVFSTYPIFSEYINDLSSPAIKQEFCSNIRKSIIEIFKGNVIPLCDKESFEDVYRRALTKCPPFSSSDNKKASDKGYKDTLIWLSLLHYDMHDDIENLVFLTKDRGFIDQKQYLVEEFKSRRNKKIEFLDVFDIEAEKNNSEENITGVNKNTTKDFFEDTTDMITTYRSAQEFRTQLNICLSEILFEESYDSWGTPVLDRRFEIDKYLEYGFLDKLKNNIDNLIKDNIMNPKVNAQEFLFLNDINCIYKIPLDAILKLYEL